MKFKKRIPALSEQQEMKRVSQYWKYLDAKSSNIIDSSLDLGAGWHKLRNEDDADYEAWYMKHSIGHSWDKYSKIGDIYSMRDHNNIPEVTILVKDGVIIHAREERNIRLSPEHMERMKQFAKKMDFIIQPDEFEFDVWLDNESQNTAIRYLYRSPDGNKIMQVVMEGRISQDDIENIASNLENGRYFRSEDVGLPHIANGVTNELLMIEHTSETPTHELFFNHVPISELILRITSNPMTPK